MDCFEILDYGYDELNLFYDDTPAPSEDNDVLLGVLEAQRGALQALEKQVLRLRAAPQRKIKHWTAEEHAAYIATLECFHYKQARYIADVLGSWTRN